MSEKMSLRNAYGKTLVELGKENENIVVLEADLGKSTMGILFQEPYPDRFFEMGIAEANMASVAGGLSLTGKIPFMASFAVFATGRCYDQIRTSICIPKLNVKICGSSAGLSDFGDGSTHQTVEDIATMRALPNMQVFSPVDAVETEKIVRYMAKEKGPMYLRVNRNDLPVLTSKDEEFVPGKVYTIREGKDAVVFATGVMVSIALEAAEELSRALSPRKSIPSSAVWAAPSANASPRAWRRRYSLSAYRIPLEPPARIMTFCSRNTA